MILNHPVRNDIKPPSATTMRLAKSWPTESTAVFAIPDTPAPGFNVQTGEKRTIGFIFFLE